MSSIDRAISAGTQRGQRGRQARAAEPEGAERQQGDLIGEVGDLGPCPGTLVGSPRRRCPKACPSAASKDSSTRWSAAKVAAAYAIATVISAATKVAASP